MSLVLQPSRLTAAQLFSICLGKCRTYSILDADADEAISIRIDQLGKVFPAVPSTVSATVNVD
jgi:hypothetical protein